MEGLPFRKEIGKFLGLFFILFLIVFTVVSLYRAFNRPEIVIPPQPVAPSKEEEKPGEKPKCIFTERANSILIPEIQIEAPLVFVEENEDFKEALNRGVIFYPETGLPDQEGETVILGHSAPVGWPKIRYDWVFSNLNQLEPGDEIYVFYENCQYTYQVIEKYFLDKGEELPQNNLESQSILTLVSCWPPGKDFRRIAIRAILKTDFQ